VQGLRSEQWISGLSKTEWEKFWVEMLMLAVADFVVRQIWAALYKLVPFFLSLLRFVLGPLTCFPSELIWNCGSYREVVGLLGRLISPVAKPLPTQDNINADIHASSGIRTPDPSVWAGKDSSCLRLYYSVYSALTSNTQINADFNSFCIDLRNSWLNNRLTVACLPLFYFYCPLSDQIICLPTSD
jgi:hypothetical protein